MIKIGEYWVDIKTNNRWDIYLYTKEEAIEMNETMIDCNNCVNCSDCANCSYCVNCFYCISCQYCDFCKACVKSVSCSHCTFVIKSVYCEGCLFCYEIQEKNMWFYEKMKELEEVFNNCEFLSEI